MPVSSGRSAPDGRTPSGDNTPSRLVLSGIFLVSLSVLALEIVLTRILSVILSYHYVFWAISTALLGLGIGGIAAYYARLPRGSSSICLAALTGVFAVSVPVTVVAVTRIPAAATITPHSLVMLVPFLFAGMVLSTAFRAFASNSGRVYAADLAGGAGGALLAIPLLDRLGGINGGLFVGVLAAGASLLLALAGGRRVWLFAISTVVTGGFLVGAVAVPGLVGLPASGNSEKELTGILQADGSGAPRIVESRWSSFGRTDLVEVPGSPDEMALFTDATAGSSMYRFNGDPASPGPALESLKSSFPGYFPLDFLSPVQKDNALVIGPGGGRDVLLMLMAGVRRTTAVEVNPDIIDIVKKYSDYNGGIYTGFPSVEVVQAEGRNYLRQQSGKYDIIMLSMPVTKTSRSPEGFALTESFLFTKESVADYLDHLTDEGRLVVVTHGEAEIVRLVSLSQAVLKERAISDGMDYIFTAGSHVNSVFVLTRSGVSREESYRRHQAIHSSAFMPESSFLPHIRISRSPDHLQTGRFDECQMLNPLLTAISAGLVGVEEATQAIAEEGFDIGVVTDNRPFFFDFETAVPAYLLSAFLLSLAFVAASLTIPRWLFRKRSAGRRDSDDGGAGHVELTGLALFFTMLGAGFMLVEIPLIQRFILFLGEPALSVSVLLFSILMGAGIGGLVSSALRGKVSPRTVCLLITVVLLPYVFVAPAVLGRFLDLSLLLRVVVSAGLLLPLGFVLGLPFPMGIRLLADMKQEGYTPWVWGINGVASVLGSVSAVIIARELGFTQALLVGAACYLVAGFALSQRAGRAGRAEA